MGLRTLHLDGNVWNVWNVVPSSQTRVDLLPADAERGWLCFESEAEKRRLVPTPESWELWNDDELIAALGRAIRVRPRVSPPVPADC